MSTNRTPEVVERSRVVRVLIIDTVVEDIRRVRDTLQPQGDFRIQAARGVDEARSLLVDGVFDVALVDGGLWNAEGADLVRFVRDRHLDIAVVLLTSGNQRDVLPALKLGAHDFFDKHQVDHGEHLAARILAAVDESRSLRRRDTMVRWLEREARTDHLTGLFTRRAFDEHLHEACRAARTDGTPVSLIVVDVVGTRSVNEAYGHEAGDAMIRRSALAISRAVRSGDFAARIGGDDFGVILRDGDLDLARRVARRVAHEIDRLNLEEPDGEIPVTVAFGVASGTACDPAQLFATADQQLSGHKNVRPAVTRLRLRSDDDGPSVA